MWLRLPLGVGFGRVVTWVPRLGLASGKTWLCLPLGVGLGWVENVLPTQGWPRASSDCVSLLGLALGEPSLRLPLRVDLERAVIASPTQGCPRVSRDLGPSLEVGLRWFVTWVPRSGLASGKPWLRLLLRVSLGRVENVFPTWDSPRTSRDCVSLSGFVTPRPIPGSAVLTPGSSLGSYIVPIDQHKSFCAHFVLTHAHPRKLPGRSSIPNCSKPSTHKLEVLLRYASKKEDAPCWYDYSINSIKPWARISQSTPLEDRRPRRSTPIQEPPLLATSMCLVSSYSMSCDHCGPTCTMRHIPEPPNPQTPVKPRELALIPLVTPRPIPGSAVLTSGSSLGSYIVPTDQHESFCAHFVLTRAHPRKSSFEIGFRKRRCTLLIWVLY
jgi:hypothetical protein